VSPQETGAGGECETSRVASTPGFQTGSGMGMKFQINGSGNGSGNDIMGMEVNGSSNCIPAYVNCWAVGCC